MVGFGTFVVRVTALAGTQLFVSGAAARPRSPRELGGREFGAPEPAEVHLPDRDDCLYAAGLFDGEGSAMLKISLPKAAEVSLRCPVCHRPSQLSPSSSLGQGAVGRHDFHAWSGKVRRSPAGPSVDGHVAEGSAFLRDISPFVRIKRAQVDNALAFQATKRPCTAGRARLTDGEWATVLAFRRRERRLNARRPVGESAGDASQAAYEE